MISELTYMTHIKISWKFPTKFLYAGLKTKGLLWKPEGWKVTVLQIFIHMIFIKFNVSHTGKQNVSKRGWRMKHTSGQPLVNAGADTS